MTDDLEQRAHRASAALRDRTDRIDSGDGLDDVLRRARRPRASTVAAVVALVALTVPAVGWLVRPAVQGIEFGGEPQVTAPPATDPAPPATVTPSAPATPGDGASPGPDEPTTAPTAAPTGDTDGEPAEPGGPLYGIDPVQEGDFPFGGGPVALLTDVRVAGQDGYDRVVLEFRGDDVPSYRVAYAGGPIVQDGSGEEIEVEGAAFLEVRLAPASGVDLSGENYEVTYEGPGRLRGDTVLVTEVVRTGDFEANLGWVIGVREEAAFSVTVMQNPMRLVIDLAHR